MISKGTYKFCRLVSALAYWTCTLPISWNHQDQYPVLILRGRQRFLWKCTSILCLAGATFQTGVILYNIYTRVKEPSVVIYGLFVCSALSAVTMTFVFMWFQSNQIILIMGSLFQSNKRIGKTIITYTYILKKVHRIGCIWLIYLCTYL